MAERIILQNFAGGLGDSLLCSTLPERWVRERGAEVYIKTFDGAFRNPQVTDVVWSRNPFVKGVVNEPTTHLMGNDTSLRQYTGKNNNCVKGMEEYFGLEPLNEYPKLYFTPNYKPELRETVLVDSHAVTAPFTREQFEPYFEMLCARYIIDRADCRVLPTSEFLHDVPRVSFGNLFELTDAIYSCRTFVTVSSGLAALASAIRGHNPYPRIIALIHQAVWNYGIWRWSNVEYYVTGQRFPDFATV